MTTITLEYNARDEQTQKAPDNILAMGFFKTKIAGSYAA